MEIDLGMNAPVDLMGAPWVGVLASTYDKANLSVDRYIEMLTQAFGKNSFRLNQNKHELVIVDPVAGTPGARLKWLSAEDVYGTVGYTFSKAIIDEAQAVPDEVFFKFRPTLSVREAQVRIFGTPDVSQAQTWFESMWLRGQDAADADYHSVAVASWDTPWMKPKDILDAKSQLSEAEYRRLYLGEWIKNAGRVFTDPELAVLANVPPYDPKKRYIMSVDFAVYEDFNVVLIAELATRTVIYKDRWNNTDPIVTYDRMASIWERFGKPWVYADASGMGAPMIAELRERGMRVVPITITAANKMPMIQNLEADIHHRRLMYPQWDDLMKEFGAFVYDRTPSGRLTANAAGGFHDDIVMCLVLLNEGFHTRSGSDVGFGYNYLKGLSLPGLQKV